MGSFARPEASHSSDSARFLSARRLLSATPVQNQRTIHPCSIHAGTLFAILFGLGLPACDGVDEDGAEAPAEADAAESDEGAEAADLDAELSLADPVRPQSAGPYPVLEIGAPFRVEDFKPNHYPVLYQDADIWHDIVVKRYDNGWSDYRPGTSSGEQNQLAWGLPVYSGVDGEVMSCWRSAPYNDAYDMVWDMLLVGGNFITIKTTAGQYVYYAHLDTNSIPSALCPNVSTNTADPGYMQECIRRTKAPGYAGYPDNCEVCDDNGTKQCSDVETYIPAGSRPQVRKGQYIGQAGAIGNAAVAHLHMQAGAVNTVGGIDRLGAPMHVTFENTWQAPLTAAVPPIAWTASSGMSIPNAVSNSHLLLWMAPKREETYSGSHRLVKLSGGVGDDLLCHDTDNGNLYTDINGASTAPYGSTDWSRTANWCKGASERLHTGDFNGDNYGDILCHDRASGSIRVDHGVVNATTLEVEFNGVDFTRLTAWCYGDTQQLLVGNFDGDSMDDLLCHNHATGQRYLDRANDGIDGTDESFATGWCYGKDERLHVGEFGVTGGGDDLLCHNVVTGNIDFDITPNTAQIFFGTPIFGATDKSTGPWCYARGQRLFVGDFSTSNTFDELLCHDSDTGMTYINTATYTFGYPGTSSTGPANSFCTGPQERLKVGDVNGDNREDLVCFDLETGARSVDYADLDTSPAGIFTGADWSTTNAWCNDPDQSLH